MSRETRGTRFLTRRMRRMVKLEDTRDRYKEIRNKWWVVHYGCVMVNSHGRPVHFDTKLAATEFRDMHLPDAEVEQIESVNLKELLLQPDYEEIRRQIGPRASW